jgi:cell division transport system permease protein
MEEKPVKRKKPSALPGILSLAAVMFILGLLGTTLLGFKSMGDHWLENSSIDIYFHDEIQETEVTKLQKDIEKKSWVSKTRFVSREQGMKEMGDKYDPDFMNYVETVTLPLSLEVYPKAQYANTEFMDQMTKMFKSQPGVEDVLFQKNWLQSMTQNIEKLQWILSGVALIFIVLSTVLINNNVRMSIFANRYTIKSMQLVGATNAFILKPFVLKSVRKSIAALPIAAICIWLLFWGLPYSGEPEFEILKEFTSHILFKDLLMVSIAIAIFGILLSTLTSLASTRKYLKLKIENLY